MNKQKKQFYKILSNYFNENKVEIESIEDAQFLEKTAILNICLPIFMEGAKKSGIKLNPALNGILMQMVAQNYKNLSVQARLINKLSANNISCAVLKGSTVSALYPDPSLRPLGDIDLLVPLEDYEKSIEVISGSKPEDKLSLMHDFHYRLHVEGIQLEIHKAIDEFEEEEESIKCFMELALNETEIMSLEQFKFPGFSFKHQAIMLLTHTKRHYFENELNIRLLLDWAMYVKSIPLDLWNNELYPLLEKLSLNKWADSLSSVCHKYLRIDIKDKIHLKYNDDITERLADEFISDRLKKNNVDITDSKEKKSFLYIFSIMNNVALKDFKIAKKCKLLLPFFWVVIAIRYIYRMKIGFRGKIDFAEFATSYKKKDALFEEIEGR